MSFFWSRIPSRVPWYVQSSCLPKAWPWQFLRISVTLTTLTALRGTGQFHFRMPLYWDLLDVFLLIGSKLWSFGSKATEVKSHFHYALPRRYQHDLSLLMLTLITWLRWCLPGFTVKLLFLHLHFHIVLCKELLCVAHTWVGALLPLQEGRIPS